MRSAKFLNTKPTLFCYWPDLPHELKCYTEVISEAEIFEHMNYIHAVIFVLPP